MSATTDHDQNQMGNDQREPDRGGEPDGVSVVLHAAALAVVGAVCRGVTEALAWINHHVTVQVCEAEMRWAHRATSYNQRAFRVIRPWWESAELLARARAKRGDDHD